MKSSIYLEVVGVQRVTDIATGKIVIQVAFGHPVPVTKEILERLPISEERAIPSEAYSNTTQIALPLSEADNYTVGSKWKLYVDPNGSIRIEKDR